MGNTDSQSSFAPPPKSSSFRFSSRRDEVPSARGWWNSNRSQGTSYVNQPASWKYDSTPNLRVSSQVPVQFGNGLNGTSLPNGGGGSPKVLLSKDGSMRVEFTNSRVAVETQGLTTSSGTVGAGPDPSLRTSKGSSLSSDGSWYDSPWGNGGELSDNVFVCGQNVDNGSGFSSYCSAYHSFFSAKVDDISPGGYSTCCSGRTEDSGIGDSVILQPEPDLSLAPPVADVYTNHSSPPAFPISPELLQQQLTASASASASAALLDDVILEEEGSGGGQDHYSSCTLPCRRTESTSSRKDFLKSRIRRLSDWTGSLSRKKRRIQDSCSGDTTVDSSRFWSCNPLHNQNQFPPVYFSSSRSLNQNQNQRSSAIQRQNIYENFMQELEPRRSSSTDELSDASEEDEDDEEEEDEEEEEVVRGQQMEVLLEKDQGVVRRVGWLSFKALLTLNKERKLELVARRKWRHYWVTLKGCTLLFYQTYGRSGGADVELSPRYALQADDGIVQAVPEHPKKEHVFCLSNAHGDVYLFQATNQTDLENWVTSIHSASASRLAKRQGKDDTVRLLRSQSRSLLHKIDMDAKMKKMAELQLSIIKEPKNRKAVETQIQQWEQNLEQLNLDLFQTRCYLSSLQGGELPNPKGLLANVSRPSKSMLGRLGVFSVSSFHALVCSRDEASLRHRCQSSSGGRVRRRGQPSSLKVLIGQNRRCGDNAPSVPQRPEGGSWCVEVAPPGGRSAHAQVRDEQTFSVFTLQFCRPDADTDFGFAVTGHVDGSGQTRVFISEVDPRGPSTTEGLRAGDQVLAVNGSSVSGLDLDLMQSLFSHRRLELLLRRDRSHDQQDPAPPAHWPTPADPSDPADPCPPPTPVWTTAPSSCPSSPPVFEDTCPQDTDHMSSLYQTFPECRAADAEAPKNPYGGEAGLQPASPAHLSVCQRLRKVIEELVDTEKSYVKDLVRLFDLYLTPLQQETFLSKDEIEALFGSLPEMLDFQRVFLHTLEDRIASCPNLGSLETPEQFKKLLFSLGGSFLYYADHFKLYSGFCANHIKVQKVLERGGLSARFCPPPPPPRWPQCATASPVKTLFVLGCSEDG
uniref:TIAM Rac1 associated GEF 2 n=1 Tax=Sphaeramia orbicularis TaxID=375764 RepID=A0A672ZJ63_9TELE